MAESLLEKANRLGIKPEQTGETLLQKAQRLGIQPEVKQPEPNYLQRVGETFAKSGERISEAVATGGEQFSKATETGNILSGVGGLLRTGLRTVGSVAESAFSPIVEAPIIKQGIDFIGKKVLQNQKINKLVKYTTDIALKYPNLSQDAKDVFNIVTLGYAPKGVGAVGKEISAITSDISQGTKALLTPSEEVVQNEIVNLFDKSIKPTAKKTLGQTERYQKDIINSLKTIKTNVDSLDIIDGTGELVTGRTPQSINEFAQAVDQTKKVVFDQYDNLAKQAGKTGVTVDAKPIAEEVLKVTQNKAIQLKNPELIKYAEDWAKRLKDFDVLDTETTQEVIKMFNNDLNAFYGKPSFENASKAVIDAGIANNFRKALDNVIENATGKEYQILKNQYASLKAIENDVVRASNREARKNVKGLLDYTDIFTNGQMVAGILSLNPAMFTKGAVERGIKQYIKFLNDPNRAVSNMFDNLNIDTNFKFTPQSEIGKYIKNPKLGLSIEDVTKSNPLIQEAKKYKTAEEFVNKQPIVYHGTSAKLKQFDNKQGTFFTDDLMNADGYAGGQNVYEGYLNLKNPLIIDAKGALHRELKTDFGKTTREVVANVDKNKYDGVIFKNIKDSWIDDAEADIPSTIYYAFKPKDAFLNKSQLIDIWNKANKK